MHILSQRLVSPTGPSRRIWTLAALVALLVPAGIGVTRFGGGEAARAAILADPMSIFAARSPGGRGAGALAQTKLAYAPTSFSSKDVAGLIPSERVLANVRTRPVAPQLNTPGFAAPQSVNGTPLGAVPTPGGGAGSTIPSFAVPTNGGGGGGGAIGGDAPGSGGGGGGGPGGGTITPVPSDVPEPTTWLMMIAGFAAIGSLLRYQRRASVAQSISRPSKPTDSVL